MAGIISKERLIADADALEAERQAKGMPSLLEALTRRQAARRRDLPQTYRFPIEALNPQQRAIVESVANTHSIDPALPGMASVATLAASIGKRYRVTDAVAGHLGYPNVYVIVAAPKSYGKGAAREIVRPLIAESVELAKTFDETTRPRLSASKGIAEKQLERLLKECAKRDPGENSEADIARLAQLESEIAQANLQLTYDPSYHIGTATGPALSEMLRRNDETLLSYSPEAGDMIRVALGRFTKDDRGDLDLFLSGYSLEPCGSTTISRGQVQLQEPCLSALWLVQPFLLRELISNEEALERGMTARILYALCERDRIPHDDGKSREIQESARFAWDQMIRLSLYKRAEGSWEPIPCEPEARELFRQFHNESVDLRNGKYREIEGELGRARENAIRVALGQCVADSLERHEPPSALTREHAKRGIDIVRWANAQQLRLLSDSMSERLGRRLERLVEIVTTHGGEATLRDLETRNCFRQDEVRALAEEFPQRIKIVRRANPSGGRPSEFVTLVPSNRRPV